MADVNDLIVTLDEVTAGSSTTDDGKTQQEETTSAKEDVSGTSPEPPSNGSPPGSLQRRQKQVSFSDETTTNDKHTDGKLDDETLLLASALVMDAKGGRTLEYILGAKYVRSYNLYNQRYLRWALSFCIALDLALAVFESPSVPGLSVPYWGTMILEILCLCYFTFRLFHAFYFQYSKVFFRDAKNVMVLSVIILTMVDMIGYIIWINVAPDTHPVRWSRPLRPLFIINFPAGKQIRRAFRNIRRSIPDIMNVLVLFILSVLMFALLALKLFYRRNMKYPNGDSYFNNYLDCVWDLYVLVTTSNSPDVMMPAYDRNSWSALFFVVYVIICLYIFMSIVLATVYNNYKKNLKNEVKEAVFLKRKKLARAFDLLKVHRGKEEIITHSCWKKLMGIILPDRSAAYTDLLMKILDRNNKNVLDKKDFLNVSDLLNVPLTEVKDRKTFLEKHIPRIYNHRISEYIKIGVRHKFFRYIFDILILVNAVFIAVDLDDADWFFLSIFAVEIICKLYTLGGKEFFQRFWNVFDLLVIGAAFVASIVEKIIGDTEDERSILDILLVLRVMRLIKIFGSIKRFKVILQTLINIGPSIVIYGGVMFVFYYFFALIGIEVFGGYIKYYGYDNHGDSTTLFCGNVRLNNSDFYKNRYCKNNFNNFAQAMVLILFLNFAALITSGFVLVTNKAARIYFYAFHVCCVVIVLNIFTAFILEAFILEFSLQTVPKLETVIEAKIKELGLGIGMKPKSKHIQGPSGDKIELIDDELFSEQPDETETNKTGDNDHDSDTDSLPDLSKERGLKFHLKKQSRKKVEVLLQQMFQGELGDSEEGPTSTDEVEGLQRTRRLTLEEIT
ncbi:unnamed protein product [Candidula unifasciata]|uniref:Ion transport domain-containing protein n=1 Tax=Candidula unifasciata TaxID=100452 RepID=A0A8S3YUA3_9EUPU|nr:unnamed protein product [Candidula unifasciata]